MLRASAGSDPWESFATYVEDRRDLHYREPAAVDTLLVAYPQSRQLAALARSATSTTNELLQRAQQADVLRPDFTTSDLYYADVSNGLALRHLPKPSPADYQRRTRFFIDSLRPR